MKRRHSVHRGVRRVSRILWALLQRIGSRTTDWVRSRRGSGYPKPPSTAWLYTLQPLEPRLLLSADLIGGMLSHDALTPVIPGESVSALVEVYRPDSEPLGNPVRIKLYASTDAVLDAKDALVGQTDVAANKLNPGNNTIKVSLDTRAIAQPGSYRLIGVIDPDNVIAESDETNNQSLASSPLLLEFAVGQVPGRSPVPSLDLTDADGTQFTLTIAGPGIARLTPNGNSYDLDLSGTDTSTRVELAGSGGDGRIALTGLSADGPLGSLLAPVASLAGTASFRNLNSLSLGDIAAGARLEGDSLTSLNVSRDALGDLHLSGVGVSGFVLGSAQVGGALGGLWSVSGRANTINAQSTRADWRASISNPLSQLVIRGDASGQFAAEALQLLQVGGSLKGMSLRIGANLGSDAVLGGSGDAADHFGPGTLARLRVTGDIEDSLIVIGIDPHNGIYHDGDDLQLGTPTRRVQELLVGGRLTGTTQISAPAFPASVRINGVVRTPASLGELASKPPDRTAPTLGAALLNDSGRSASDGITRDASISGQASDAGGVTRLLAALDPTGTPGFVDLSSALQPDGRFVLTPALLDSLAGGTLADGTHSVRLVAQDAAGNASRPTEIGFSLDTLGPMAPSFGLSLASDTGTSSDGSTAAAIVTLQGSAEPGSQLNLNPGDHAALAGAGGVFQFANVALAAGANLFTLTATDAAGNTSLPAVQTFTREGVATTDAVSTWHAETLATIVRDAEDAPAASRTLAIESLAVFDVVNAFEGTPSFAIGLHAPAGANLDAAIAAAAHRVLVGLYPGQAQALDARLAESLAAIAGGQAKTDGVAFGVTLADAILALRAGDGYKDFVDYPGSTALGQWRSTGPSFELAALPQWADVEPFVLASPDALRPGAPPALDSAAYATALEEVRALGSAASALRTADQTQTVHFWADGPGTTTPSGHWNEIAGAIATEQGLSAGAKARLFAQLNVALADAGVAAWDAKYFYGMWRPETAIANAADDGNDATQFEAGWRPRLITPNHPEYVSGHSSYSAAAAAVLESAFGASFAFDTTSAGLPGVTRHFASFDQAAQEAGRSRIYGGIHYEFTNQAGQQLGREVADAVLARFALNEDTQGPAVVLETSPAAANTNLSFTGQVLDNLAGVASLQVEIDPVDAFEGEGEPPAPQILDIAFDGAGSFSFTTAFATDGTEDGAHELRFTARDTAGNASAPVSRFFTLDTRAPEITITSLTDGGELGASARASGTADPTGATLATLGYALDGGATVPLIFDTRSGSFDEALDLSRLGTGAHQITITARDAAGNQASSTLNLTLAQPVPLTVVRTSPEPGSDDVGSTFRPQVFFSRAVDPATLIADTFYATDTTGAKLPATIVTGDGGRFAWLFFQGPMPGASTITVHLKAADIHAASDGQALDADGNGTPEADFTWRFSTVSLASIPGTTLSGTLLDPGPDFEPMTYDDVRRGPDGIPHTADDVFLNPIAHAHVHVLGRPDTSTFTDANGRFELVDLPAGNVKLVINGNTATNAPAGHYWPEMTLDLTLEAGLPNTVMGSMGTREEMAANEERTEVYLPRLKSAILQQVANDQAATITLDPASTTDLTPEQVAQLRLEFQPDSLIGEDGQPLANAQIGISTVPPELVRDMLPPGVLQHTFDITIQAPGVAAFSEPLQISFPNVFNAAPGTKANFLSFDHTTGRLVIEGTVTVSEDGKSVTTDPGQGITKPGWHGLVSLGSFGFGPIRVTVGVADEVNGCDFFSFMENFFSLQLTVASLGLSAQVGLGKYVIYNSAQFAVNAIQAQNAILKNGSQPPTASQIISATSLATQIAPVMSLFGKSVLRQFGATLSPAAWKGISGLYGLPTTAAVLFQAADSFFSAKELYEYFKCIGIKWNPPPQLNFDPLKWFPFLNDLDSASSQLVNAVVNSLGNIGSLLTSPTTTSSALTSHAQVDPQLAEGPHYEVTTLETDLSEYYLLAHAESIFLLSPTGDPLVDTISGKPISAPISELFVPEQLSDPAWRQQAADSILNGLNSLSAYLQSLLETPNDHLEEVLGTTNIGNLALASIGGEQTKETVWLRVSELGQNRTLYQGPASDSAIPQLVLPPNSLVRIEGAIPDTSAYGSIVALTGSSGATTELLSLAPNPKFLPAELEVFPSQPLTLSSGSTTDADTDGLIDVIEAVYGTNPKASDTDGDGVSDRAEVLQGADPLGGRALPAGIVASLSLQGQAKAVVLEGSTTSAETQTAYVATGSYGLATVNASSFRQPVLLGQIDLPGDAVDVSVDSRLGIAAVASTTGLQLVDVSDPAAPRLRQSVNAPATQVEVLDGIAFVTAGAGLESYSVQTGELLQVLPLGGATLTGLAREGRSLYTLDANHMLRVIDVARQTMQTRGALSLAGGTGKLFVGNGIAYVAAGDGNTTGGYLTIDVSNAAAPALISGVDAINVQGQAIAANGSGLAVSVGTLPRFGGVLDFEVNVLDVSDPASTDRFITSFDLPAAPYDIAIGAGIAFVADGSGGLKVVSYQGFDSLGQPPAAALAVTSPDADPTAPGLQLPEGGQIDLRASVSDDRQVRNVELLLNGQVVANDVSFPWDLAVALPPIAGGGDTATLQLRATDTGGNRSLSNEVTVQLLSDALAPTIASSNVVEGSRHGNGFRTILLQFSEAMDPAGITGASFWLQDGAGQIVAPLDVALGADARTATLTVPVLASGQYTLRLHGPAVRDRVGNALADHVVDYRHFSIADASIFWSAPAGGEWANPANWDLGRVPTALDDVFIEASPEAVITMNGTTVEVASLETRNAMSIASSTLTVRGDFLAHANVTLRSSTLARASLAIDASKQMLVQAGTLRQVVANGDVVVDESSLTIKDLTLNGRLFVISRFHGGQGAHTNVSTVWVEGTQELAGTGEVVFVDGAFGEQNFLRMSQAGELTVGEGITLRGQTANIGGTGGAHMTRLVNHGRIVADQGSNGSISISADSVYNDGMLGAGGAASFPGELSVSNVTNAGVIETQDGGRVTISGPWTSAGGRLRTLGGTMDLGGTFETFGFGGFEGTSGTVRFGGVVQNAGNALELPDIPVIWTLTGTVREGTLTVAPGALLQVKGGRLEGVTLAGDAIVDESSVTLKGLTLNGRLTVASRFHGGQGAHTNVSTVLLEGTQELRGTGEVVFFDGAFGESNYLEMSQEGEFTIGPEITVRGSAGSIGGHLRANAPMTRLVNDGRVVADTGGNGSLGISAETLVNHGSLGSSGTGRLFLANAWTSPGGSIDLSGGTVDLGGVFDTAGFGGVHGVGGTLRISGTVENGTGILALEGTSTWQLKGVIRGGVVTVQQGQELLAAGGQIEGVTINGDVLLNESRLFVKGMTLNGTMTLLSKTHYPDFGWGVSELLLLGSQTWDGNGQIVFTDNGAGEANFVEMVQSGQLTIGTGLTLRGRNGVIGGHRLYTGTMTDFINHGAVIADTGPSFLSISASQVMNDGVLRATNGATLSLPNFAANQGTVSLGVGGRVSVSGSFENAPTGSVQVAIAGPASSQYGRITVSGNAALDGNLNVTLDSSFVPTIGQTFAIVAYGSHAGSFALINDTDPGDGVTYTPTYNATNLTLSAVA